MGATQLHSAGAGSEFLIQQAFLVQILHSLEEFGVTGMLIHQGVGAVGQHAELGVRGGCDAKGIQQAGHGAFAVGA